MAIKQISVFLENRPGQLDAMTKVLADAGITLRALSLAETKDFGILRFLYMLYAQNHVGAPCLAACEGGVHILHVHLRGGECGKHFMQSSDHIRNLDRHDRRHA